MSRESKINIAQSSIGERLRHAAGELRITLSGLAHLTDIPYRSIQNYARDEREPSASALKKLSEEAGININWLLTGRGKPFHSDYLDALVVDVVIILHMDEILKECFSGPDSVFDDDQKIHLLSYMVANIDVPKWLRTFMKTATREQLSRGHREGPQ